MYYAQSGDTEKALENMELFTRETNFHYWILLFFKMDPLIDNIRELPEFKKILSKIEYNFWENHEKIRELLEKEELL